MFFKRNPETACRQERKNNDRSLCNIVPLDPQPNIHSKKTQTLAYVGYKKRPYGSDQGFRSETPRAVIRLPGLSAAPRRSADWLHVESVALQRTTRTFCQHGRKTELTPVNTQTASPLLLPPPLSACFRVKRGLEWRIIISLGVIMDT